MMETEGEEITLQTGEKVLKIGDLIIRDSHAPQRLEDETYDEYKVRRRLSNRKIKMKLKGQIQWYSQYQGPYSDVGKQSTKKLWNSFKKMGITRKNFDEFIVNISKGEE